jgi:hypothetical protein
MRTFAAIILLSMTGLVCQAQIDYRPGYYIRNDGTRITCLILDYGWRSNPTGIRCKMSTDAPPAMIEQDSILEFGVGDLKYQRYDIRVDTSSRDIGDLGTTSQPLFRRETALLEVMVEGRATLYRYCKKNITLFFFKVVGASPEPLVFKQYMPESNKMAENTEYIGQLRDSLDCRAPGLPDPGTLHYDGPGLRRFFIAYNRCIQSPFVDHRTKSGKATYHLNIRPGIDFGGLTIADFNSGRKIDFAYGQKTQIRIGAEAEFMLNFDRNKWSALVEPAYRTYAANPKPGFHVDYRSIQVAEGGRYYMFVGTRSKFYLTGEFYVAFPISSTIEYEGAGLQTHLHFGGLLGVGFRYADRVSLDLTWSIPEQVLAYYAYLRSDLSGTWLTLSYSIL